VGSRESLFLRGKDPLMAKEGAEKVVRETKSVPQRLKLHCKHDPCGTAEAVPLSKTNFFSIF
jgi:hypothetical protein